MSENAEELYQCIGICMADPDSGYCQGCGRPPLASPEIVAEAATPVAGALPVGAKNPDSPEDRPATGLQARG